HHGGGAFSHDIIAAVEKAVADGMDVINLSIGGRVQGPHDLLSEAINAAVDAGTVAVIAAGNSGPGILTVESPGNAANAITAAAAADPHFEGIKATFDTTTIGAAVGEFVHFVATNADSLAACSSRRPTPYDFRLKPDVTAPGVSGLSSVLGGECALSRGTSMAAPHTTGAAGLLLAAHPTWWPDEVKSARV